MGDGDAAPSADTVDPSLGADELSSPHPADIAASGRRGVAEGVIDALEPAPDRSSEGVVPALDAGVEEAEGRLALPPIEDDWAVEVGAGAVEIGAGGTEVAVLVDAVDVAARLGGCGLADGLVGELDRVADGGRPRDIERGFGCVFEEPDIRREAPHDGVG
jgi:hypothetical protein